MTKHENTRPGPIHKITVRGIVGNVKYVYYAQGNIAIQYMGDAGPLGTLTVNLPDDELDDGEFAVKTWSENEQLAKAAFATGLFEDTGKRIPTGFVEAQVWRFAKAEQNQ